MVREMVLSVERPVSPVKQEQSRRWFAQIVVPKCDPALVPGYVLDGTVDVVLGEIPSGQGEVFIAEKRANDLVEGTDLFVSSFWFEGGALEF